MTVVNKQAWGLLVLAFVVALFVPREALAANSTVEGEAMTLSSSGASIINNDANASGGKALALSTNGSYGTNTVSTKVFNKVLIRARGIQCNGSPNMTLYVDGVAKNTWTVTQTAYFAYALDVTPYAAGNHIVKVAMSNDYASSTCNRGLRIDYVQTTNRPVALGTKVPAYPDWPPNEAPYDDFVSTVGETPNFIEWFQDWGDPSTVNLRTGFVKEHFDGVASHGATPLMTWEPKYGDNVTQPDYSLDNIAAGNYDAYVRKTAQDMKAWNRPIYLRFAHEMNGDWYPWGKGVNGNGPGDYVAAWRHVHDIFVQEGATNVRWVWAANVKTEPSNPSEFASYYPGDAYVDWLALDGYNLGNGVGGTPEFPYNGYWEMFRQVFDTSYAEITSSNLSAANKPLMIAETATGEDYGTPGRKASWITQAMLTDVPYSYPRVRALCWFDLYRERDWRVNSTQASLDAYKAAIADPIYDGALP